MSSAITKENLKQLKEHNPFSYNLDVKIIPSKKKNADVTICCHGYGHSNQIVDVVHSFKVLPDHLIGFNFPDYKITSAHDHTKSSFGSIDELLPLLYIIKRCIVDLKIPTINLYGFSAGGGAVINTLAILNKAQYPQQLQKIGITEHVRQQIIHALEDGLIILDCPLKSIEELIAMRGNSPQFKILRERYDANKMNPIDTVQELSGLKLKILLHFQNPDEILGNRDDQLFIDRLHAAHVGITKVVMGSEGGHNTYHTSLWKKYQVL